MNKKLTCIITLALLMINGMALAQDPPAHVKVPGNVYGGGNKAVVMGSSSVLMNKSNSDTILGDVYAVGSFEVRQLHFLLRDAECRMVSRYCRLHLVVELFVLNVFQTFNA